jgi:hypothetical protein
MRAFTLIELVLYLALMTLLMTGAVAGAAALTESASRNQVRARIELDGAFVGRRIAYACAQALAVAYEAHELHLVTTEGEGAVSTHDGLLVLMSTGTTSPLTDPSLTASELLVEGGGIDGSAEDPAWIRTTFTLSGIPRSGPPIALPFSVTCYLP